MPASRSSDRFCLQVGMASYISAFSAAHWLNTLQCKILEAFHSLVSPNRRLRMTDVLKRLFVFLSGSHSLQAISNVTEEIVATRNAISSLTCGVRKADPVRVKRLLGGVVALKVPWQVGIDDQNEVYCGGIYIGGCWVLTAAHCVRPKPELYRVKLGMWNSLRSDANTDSLPAETVIIHEDFNPSTYENDIALIKFKNVYKNKECIRENKFVAPVCIPWSEYQFKPGHKCIISGWGRAEAYKRVYILNVATIEIIGNCSGIYGKRYFKGMECAGTFDGTVDTCQGDSGGPLVCTDDSGVAYVWGIVSWGEKCGVANYPGVYTKVAYYYEWISYHVGRSSISRYNI
ncbi:CFAI factor, partial [Polypterus senegalus]